MTHHYRHFIIVFLLFINGITIVFSQVDDKIHFLPPVDIPIYLSGNFAEFRSNHFHSGIDIKTQGRTGHKIYAIEKGYVSRIKVSPVGYGYALYLTHPNGFTSVYGHLERYNEEISAYVKAVQYKKESFYVDLYLPGGKLQVDKGEVIAYSGNSGSSSGPHLHFEIRDADTQWPVNPLLYDFPVKDNVKPVLYQVGITPLDNGSYVEGKNSKHFIRVYGNNGNYYLNNKNPVNVWGKIGFSIRANDFLNGAYNRCGIYTLEMQLDSNRIFFDEFRAFSFYETRYINSLIDYEEYQRKRVRFHRAYVEPNNKLSVYKDVKNNGIIDCTDGQIHTINFIAKDVYGNTSRLSFKIECQKNNSVTKEPEREYEMIMLYDKDNYVYKDNIIISVFKGSLYDTLKFTYSVSDSLPGAFSRVHHIGSEYVPLHKPITIDIKPSGLPKNMQSKALLAKINDKGNTYAAGGRWNNGFISLRTRYFGKYYVTVDTIPPEIILYTKLQNRNLSEISLRIDDDFSGIDSYRGTIDGKWVLFTYDKKRKQIEHHLDSTVIQQGKKHELILVVKDKKGNKSTFTRHFYW
jgi:hypothetical protein